MNDRQKLQAQDKKEMIYFDRDGKCEVCNKTIPFNQAQLAHRICKSKMNLAKYGSEVIHHPLNMALTCSLKCNAKVNIGNNPGKILDVLTEIIEADR